MDAESNLAEVAVSSNNGSTSGEPKDPTVLKEKLADELKSAASLKGGGDGPALDVPLEKDDLLERLDKIDTDSSDAAAKPSGASASTNDVDMENDDLIQRLEALEKGEDETTTAKDAAPEKKKDEAAGEPIETNHQNGLDKENEADLLQEEVSKEKVEEKMEVDASKEEKKVDEASKEEKKVEVVSKEEKKLEVPSKEEKKVEEISKKEKEVKEPEAPMEVGKPSEQPAKDDEDVSVSEQKEEEDSTPAVVETAESSKAVTEPKPAAAEAESKVDSKPVEEQLKTVEKETKVEEKVEDVAEKKPSEEKVEELVVEVQKPAAPKKAEDVKESEKTKPVEEEPAPSQPVEDVPKPTQEEKAQPESPPEQPAPEAVPKSKELPDTEPNTESSQEEQPTSSSPAVVEEKTDDAISSSSEKKEEQAVPSSTEVDSAATAAAVEQPAEKPCETETVTSSDEKPPKEAAISQEVDSTPEKAPVAASEPANDDEPMEVDSEPVAETSSKKEVSEPPCTKKEAYECTEESAEKASAAKPQEVAVEAVPESASAPVPVQESVPKAAEQEEEKMEVDSAAPTQSKPDPDVTESMNTTSEELIVSMAKDDTATAADSQSETAATVSEHNKNMDATEGATEDSKADASKTLDDSIECSLPTSSSDKMADRLKQRLDLISNGSSTPNAAVSSSNVYNSTPIQKQFEISSENVSKISRNSVDNSHQADEEHSAITVGDQSSISEEKEAAVASTSGVSKPPAEVKKQLVTDTSDDTSVTIKDGSSLKTESSEVDSCTASSALNTADEINMYATNARKFNGISSTSGSELEDKSTITPTNVSTTDAPSTVVNKLDLTPTLTSEETLYEVSVWFDGTELQFLSIEKLENKSSTSGATAGSTQDLTGIDSSKQSSNGSVGSLGPFSLPPARPAADSAMSHSTATETSSGTSQLKPSLPKMKHTVRGAKALATLMIEEFTKIKRALSKDDEVSDNEPETPMKTPKGRPGSVAKKAATPSARGQKRSRTDSDATEEELSKSKQAAKQAKKGSKVESSSPSETTGTAEPPAKKEDEQCCLARWTDRKYYAGRVTGYKGDNKFMVVFEDGASKALSKDVIVFGDMDTLPIMGHSIHALTGGDTYEPGIVQELKRNESDEVVYSVQIATGTVEVTASDMYLTDEQAKYINKACKAAEAADEKNTSMQSPRGANTPVMQTPEEASGAASAEKGSRSTRRRGADKPQTPVTPEAGYSGGVGKKGRRGRSKAQQAQLQTSAISECSDVSDIVEEEIPVPPSPETALEFVDGVQPELQRTEKESEIRKMYLVAEYLGHERQLAELLGPLPGSKTLFRNKHFILTCTIPPRGSCNTPETNDMRNKYRQFSAIPFVKEHLRQQIETGGGKVYQHFEDIPKAKYKQCKLIAPHPSATAKYVQCLAVDIPAVSHEWIIQCCQTLTFVEFKSFALPAGWSLLDERYIRWSCGRAADQRSTVNPFAGHCVNIASMDKDFTEFWGRVCKLAGGTVRLIKSETDLTENLSGYMLTDQEFPEDVKLRATRYGLLIVSTVWVVQSLVVGRICQPDSHEKLTQIYQDDDY
ncbi:TP53-binding protein 1-like isoform X2 [Ochlerotatus camptorhynchus]|uniref:TP53-binding protein 1-like isoform X2 n=1 Tax=Ochlerotatus camptorhynchus TaxID=644619 RepID=UPI0031D45145